MWNRIPLLGYATLRLIDVLLVVGTQAVLHSQIVPPEVVGRQPRLHFDPTETDQLMEIKFRINRTEQETYYTYVYVLPFSDTPLVGELLGYPDHNWDFEPVIVCVSNETGRARYIYDKGHYRAGVTVDRELRVEKGAHYFRPSNESGGRVYPAEYFKEITVEELQLMESLLKCVPRLPLGRQLSLNWACKNPAKVEQESCFSSDETAAHLPKVVAGIGGMIAGTVMATTINLMKSLTRTATNLSWYVSPGVGAVCGVVGGVIGRIVGEIVLNATDSVVLGVIASTLSAAVLGIGTGYIVGGIHGTFSGCTAAATGGLLASLL